MPGNLLPLIALTQGIDFVLGILAGGNVGTDDYFANFQPLAGSLLINQRVATYPSANQAIAANATIAEPLTVPMLMFVPASAAGGYLTKLAVMTALQATLAQHNASGGTYTVATPSYFYTNCLMTSLRDVTPAASKQAQIAYQFDFFVPLLTLQSIQNAQNSLMAKISGGLPLQGQDGAQFGSQAAVGSQGSGATPSISPPTAGSPASSATPFSGSPL
jgi:hypothetical protein